MNRSVLRCFIVISAFSLGLFSQAQGGVFSSNVEKARDFVKANMIEQAVELLKKEIEQNPKNTAAHIELGSIYVRQGNLRLANERFKGAVNLDPKLSSQVAQLYEDTGLGLLNRGNHATARDCFTHAVSFQPARKSAITELCMKNGKEQLDRENIEGARTCFEMASSFQPSLNPQIAKIYFDKAQAILQNADSSSSETYLII